MNKIFISIFRIAALATLLLLSTHAAAQSDELKQRAIAAVQGFLDRVPASDSDVLMRDGQEISIEISGIEDEAISQSVNENFTRALINRDADTLVGILIEYHLQIDLEGTTDEVFRFTVDNAATPEGRLHRAVVANDNQTAIEIIENESPDLEKPSSQGVFVVTPLAVAAMNNNVELVRVLLENGADAVNRPEKMLSHPMSSAVANANIEMIRLFLEAGTPLDLRVGGLDRDPLPLWAVRLDSMELMELLVERGADLGSNGVHGWTALDIALVEGNREMIDFLVEHSNPLHRIWSLRRTETGLKGTRDYPLFPRSNALFFARLFGDAGVENLEQRLLGRAETLGGISARRLLELHAGSSASELAYEEQKPDVALARLEETLANVDESTLSGAASADYVTTVMSLLVELHKLRLINGMAFDGKPRELAEYITSIGGDKAGIHGMLDVLQAAADGDAAGALADWKSTYHLSSLGERPQFGRLNTWVEEEFDGEVRDRLHDVLDFYELPRFRNLK